MEANERVPVALDFLKRLWAGKPAEGAVQVWNKGTKTTYTYADLSAAAAGAAAMSYTTDIYMAAGLARRTGKPVKRRATAAQVAAIPGLWADIDLNGGPDAKADAAPDFDTAIELAGELIEPTVLVASGYGLQAWWLLDEPWPFTLPEEREQAQRLSAAFQSALRARARQRGFGLDSTHDLARLMRLPGTINHKGGEQADVRLLDHDGPRYNIETLGELCAQYMRETGDVLATLTGAAIDITLDDGDVPHARLAEVCEIDPDFDAVWSHRASPKTKSWSASEFDLSIADTLVKAGFSDQEIARSLRYHRRRHYSDSDKGERLDYLKRTIGKARGSERHQRDQREAEYEREDTIEQLTEVATAAGGGAVSASVTISLFAQVVGGPEIKELVQEGRDPDNSRFKLVIADGREVPLGSIEGLISQEKFRAKFAVVTAHLPRRVKPAKWDDVVQALLNAATINEGSEDTRPARALAWVDRYCERRVSTDKDAACEAHDPFRDDGVLFIPLSPLRQWLNKIMGERVAEIDLKLMLEAAGFERHTVNYQRPNGARSTRSYFRVPMDLLQQDLGRDDTDQPKKATA